MVIDAVLVQYAAHFVAFAAAGRCRLPALAGYWRLAAGRTAPATDPFFSEQALLLTSVGAGGML